MPAQALQDELVKRRTHKRRPGAGHTVRRLMRSKLAAILFIATALAFSGCERHDYRSDGSFLDLRLTVASSPREIEVVFRDLLAARYENPADGFSIYSVSNANTHFMFVRAFNYPRGLAVFSLYCYEKTSPSEWRLRAFVPVNEYYYTNDNTRTLRFDAQGEHVNAKFRGVTVLTVASIHGKLTAK